MVTKVTRASDGKTLRIDLQEAEQADTTARAKRVILTDADGTAFSSSNPLNVDTELTLDGNVIIDNVSVYATDIADSSTTSFALVDANGHQQIDVLTLPDVDINDISKGTQTNDVKITLDGETIGVTSLSGTVLSTAVTIADTSTIIPASDLVNRKSMTIRNNGSNTIFIGGSGVTTANGFPIKVNESIDIDLDDASALYGIVATGTEDLRILEVS